MFFFLKNFIFNDFFKCIIKYEYKFYYKKNILIIDVSFIHFMYSINNICMYFLQVNVMSLTQVFLYVKM